MKRIITYSFICITICILFSSCTSNISIVKRHYNSGYYVDYTHAKYNRAGLVSRREGKKIHTNQMTFLNIARNPEGRRAIAANFGPSGKMEIRPKTSLKLTSNQGLLQKIHIIAGIPEQTEQFFAAPDRINNERNEREGLSLLWIVIILILILWIIGILAHDFGFGALINILLIIALILLILWLLKVA